MAREFWKARSKSLKREFCARGTASDVPEIRANRRAEQGEESVTVALATLLLTGLRTCQVPAELARPLLADLLECHFRMIYPPTGEE